MNPFDATEETISYCGACGEELVRNTGRYLFDDNAYCITCWGKSDVRMNLRRGTVSGRIAMKGEG